MGTETFHGVTSASYSWSDGSNTAPARPGAELVERGALGRGETKVARR